MYEGKLKVNGYEVDIKLPSENVFHPDGEGGHVTVSEKLFGLESENNQFSESINDIYNGNLSVIDGNYLTSVSVQWEQGSYNSSGYVDSVNYCRVHHRRYADRIVIFNPQALTIVVYRCNDDGTYIKTEVSATSETKIDVALKASYSYVIRCTNGTLITPNDVGITIREYAKLNNDLVKHTNELRDITNNHLYDNIGNSEWESGTLGTQGEVPVNDNPSYIRSAFLNCGDSVIIHNPNNYTIYLCGYDEEKACVIERIKLDSNRYQFKDSARYYRIAVKVTLAEYDNSIVLTNKGITRIQEPIKWYALGDSITEGRANEGDGSASIAKYQHSYPNFCAELNGYNLVNLGEHGSGMLAGGADTGQKLKDFIDLNTFTDADIITIAYGINDYLGSKTLGTVDDAVDANTCMGKLKYAISTLIGDGTRGSGKAPHARIIVLSPMNGSRQYSGYFQDTVTFEGNWYLGARNNKGNTLADFKRVIKEVCDYYSVQVIDMNEISLLNRGNLMSMLGDGLHPTTEGHKKIGRALASYLV